MSNVLLKLDKSILDDAVKYVLPVTSGKNSMPILSSLLFSTTVVKRGTDEEFMFLVISGCDTEKKLSVKIDKEADGVEVMDEMNIAVPAKKLNQLLTSLPKEGTVSLSRGKAEGSVILKPSAVRSKYTLSALPGQDFPDLSLDNERVKFFEIERQELLNAIVQVEKGAPSDDVRQFLNGVHFKSIEDQKMDIVSTNGHRLFKTTVQAKTVKDKPFPDVNLILPKASVKSFLNLLKSSEVDDVRIGVTKNHLFAKVGDRQLFTCLVDDKFPDYNPAIPSNLAVQVEVNTSELLGCVKRCMLIHGDKDEGKPTMLYLGDRTLKLKSVDNKTGRDTVYQEMEVSETSPIEIAFHGTYMVDALSAFTSKEITLGFNGSESSILIKSKGDALNAVIMPIKTA